MERVSDLFRQLADEARVWCRQKRWEWRLAILACFLYFLVKYWSRPDYTCIISGLNLGIHELGHLVFSFLGEFIGILGGTLLQIAAPIFSVINFYRQNDFFAIALSFGWLSTSLFDSARYISDASAMNLPLVSPFGGRGENTIHDWNYLLSKFGLLRFDTVLGFLVKILATVSMITCLLVGGWLLLEMKKSKE